MQEPQISSSPIRPHHALVRLERNNQELQVLKENMRSYICEPKTLSLFERFEGLKDQLELMRQKNNELITALREHKQSLGDLMKRMVEQFSEFKQLEQQILEYIGMAKLHA